MKIDMDDFKEKRKYLVSAPVLGHMYLLIKVHKTGVSQIDNTAYKSARFDRYIKSKSSKRENHIFTILRI